MECLAPGTIQRASSPLEVTLSVQPTLVLQNALPYDMRVLLWQHMPAPPMGEGAGGPAEPPGARASMVSRRPRRSADCTIQVPEAARHVVCWLPLPCPCANSACKDAPNHPLLSVPQPPGAGPGNHHPRRRAAAPIPHGTGEHWPALPARLCEPAGRRCTGGWAAPPDGPLRGLHPGQRRQAGGFGLAVLQMGGKGGAVHMACVYSVLRSPSFRTPISLPTYHHVPLAPVVLPPCHHRACTWTCGRWCSCTPAWRRLACAARAGPPSVMACATHSWQTAPWAWRRRPSAWLVWVCAGGERLEACR